MNLYKMVIAYDGTDFCGWAPQPNQRSVSQVLQQKFQEIFHHPVTIVGASRTDAGVHALGQVARFHSDLAINTYSLRKAWNNRLGGSVMIRSLELVTDQFHPQHSVINKTYYYHFFPTMPFPFLTRYGLYHPKALDIALLNQTLQLFVGTHNFRSFSTGEPIGDNPICTIESIQIHHLKRFGMYQMSITGNRFLRHMVRRLVGAALLTAKQESPVTLNQVYDIFKAENQSHFLPTAPAKGLLLYKIRYKQ